MLYTYLEVFELKNLKNSFCLNVMYMLLHVMYLWNMPFDFVVIYFCEFAP